MPSLLNDDYLQWFPARRRRTRAEARQLEIFAPRFAVNAEPGDFEADKIDAPSPNQNSQYPRVAAARILPLFGAGSGLRGSNALSTIRIREALAFCSIKEL